jgi:hypothetical protein
MSKYDNTNSGILARNSRKDKETHPDYTGQADIDGVGYWISGWLKTGKDGSKLAGQKFFSLKFKPKDTQQAAPAPKATPENDEDVPF